MSSYKFEKFMSSLDLNFSKQDFQIHDRPMKAVYYIKFESSLCSETDLGISELTESKFEKKLLHKTTEWYEKKYGDRINIRGYLERFPTYINNQLFFFKIPNVWGCLKDINIFDHFENLSIEIKKNMSQEDIGLQIKGYISAYNTSNIFEELIRITKIRGSTSLKGKFDYTLMLEDGEMEFLKKVHKLEKEEYQTKLLFSNNEKELLRSSYADRQTALLSFENSNYSIAAFSSQQHVEKMMKIILLHKKICKYENLKKYSHNLESIFHEIKSLDDFPVRVFEMIQFLNSYKMEYRYNSKEMNNSFALKMLWESIITVSELTKFLLKREGYRIAVYKDKRLHFIDTRYFKIFDQTLS